MTFRFAANLSLLFADRPWVQRLEAAAAAGFKLVEAQFPYDLPAQEMHAHLDRLNLRLVMINAPPGDFAAGDRGLAAVADRSEAFRQSIETAATYATITGAAIVHVMSGVADLAQAPVRRLWLDNLAWAADRLAQAGLTMVIEPLNPYDNPGYALADFTFAEQAIAELARPNLKLLFDVYHRQRLHGEVTSALRRLAPIIGHIQVAGAPDRHEPDQGELNYDHIFAALCAQGYGGVIGCEYRPRGDTAEGLGWMARWS